MNNPSYFKPNDVFTPLTQEHFKSQFELAAHISYVASCSYELQTNEASPSHSYSPGAHAIVPHLPNGFNIIDFTNS